MGYISLRNAETLKNCEEKVFLGLNRGVRVSAGEFYDMQNMSSDEYPCIAVRKPIEKSELFNTIQKTADGETASVSIENVRAVAAPHENTSQAGFCGVIGTTFYYNGKEKPMKADAEYDADGKYIYGMAIPSDGKIQLLWSNNILIIHGYDSAVRDPFIYYYNTDDENTNDDYVKSSEYDDVGSFTTQTISFKADGYAYISIEYKVLVGKFSGGYFNFKKGDSVFIDELMTYNDSRRKKYPANVPISATVIKYSESYVSGDGGYQTWKIELILDVLNSAGKHPFDSVFSRTVKHIYKKIPYMSRITLHKGRLWGANPNGEYVYASSIENLMDFSSFENLSSDSAFLESSTQGGYLGVISCGDALVAFKKNELEAIYGELPNEFAVGKSYLGCGCSDISSCVVISNTLYFLGSDGFYMWNGSNPLLISKKLNRKYKNAFSYTDGIHYFASAKYNDKCENLVFDPRYGIWHKEDEKPISGAFRFDSDFYILTGDAIYKLNSGSKNIKWFAESVRYFFDEIELKRINELWFKVVLDKDSEFNVYTSCQNKAWSLCTDRITGKYDGEFKTIRVPVRLDEGDFWRYRIEGCGSCCIMGVKFIGDIGGKSYK